MSDHPGMQTYIQSYDQCVSAYIPPRAEWTPADEALYGVTDLFRVPLDQAEEMRFRAIRHTFNHQYQYNKMYRKFCQENGFSPDDLLGPQDLERIPLIPGRFFKDYPDGEDFALWLANIYTGKLPRIEVKKGENMVEETLRAFNAAGLVVAFSSGTSGRQTFIPRDRRTFNASEYAIAKSGITMTYPSWERGMDGYLLMPNPKKTNVFAGKVATIYFDTMRDVQVALNRNVSMDVIRMAMSGQGGLKARLVRKVVQWSSLRMVDKIIRWMEKHEKGEVKMTLAGAPFLVMSVIKRLESRGLSFDFSGKAGIITGGGWKVYENQRITSAEFRQAAQRTLGVLPEHCLDVYGMVEGNAWNIHCPEGHYFHIPYTYFKPLVLDKDNKPLGYGEWGRFAFLDALATSYPGFMTTGDMVRMLEHCPACDRPGPVLEPEIRRATGEDLRGCAEEMRRTMAMDIG